MSKVLCWLGYHKYELNRIIRRGVEANLMGHSCVRCGAIPLEQSGLE